MVQVFLNTGTSYYVPGNLVVPTRFMHMDVVYLLYFAKELRQAIQFDPWQFVISRVE